MIHLSVGHLVVDWGKNIYFKDHSALFQDRDLKPVPSYYAGDNWPQGVNSCGRMDGGMHDDRNRPRTDLAGRFA
jgi:HEPN/Toprim N-terminal domain 1